ncbi:hypothetical protein CEX98_08555, partial [Pseudoalteromonas piscicida]
DQNSVLNLNVLAVDSTTFRYPDPEGNAEVLSFISESYKPYHRLRLARWMGVETRMIMSTSFDRGNVG